MILTALPPASEMYEALLSRDTSYEGVFITGVRTTGIFCRPTCTARKPLRQNVEFFRSSQDALFAGYRACKRCRPLEPHGRPPAWLRDLLQRVEDDSTRRWRDHDLRTLGLDPVRVRRWFQSTHGMTFHAYHRARRLGRALGRIREGSQVTDTAFGSGFESLSGFNDAFSRLFGVSPGQSRERTLVTVTRILTPMGPMVAGATTDQLCLLEFADRRMLETQIRRLQTRLDCAVTPGSNEILKRIDEELSAYFDRRLHCFTVPLFLEGTPFQKRVWEALLRIPYGETASYGELARSIDAPQAVRAVGRANGDNRMAIVVPCHRVIGGDGRLTGYGGGLWRKRALLDLESAQESLLADADDESSLRA